MPKALSSGIPHSDTISDLLKWLRQTKTKGIIIGGVATSLLGQPRFTQDIDLLVISDSSEWENFFKTGVSSGFIGRISNALDFARKNRVLLLRHSKSGVNVDISFGALPFEEECLKRAQKIKVGPLNIPLPTAEDLIIMKAVAHRFKDLDDIRIILEVHPHVDKKRIRKWVKEFSVLLESPEVYKDLEKLLQA